MLLTTLAAAGMGGLLGMFPNLSGPASAVEALLILCGIVAFHELGHFVAARSQGIHVSKFAIGFGPTLLAFQPGEVEYSLRALPLGGFVAFPDNDEDCPYPEDDPDLLKNRPILDRFFVISAGVVFNMILAFGVLVAQVNNVGYNDITYQQGVRLPIIQPGSAAERYGLLPGDMVLELDGVPVKPGARAVADVVGTVQKHTDLSIDFTVARKVGKTRTIEHVQVLPDLGADGKGRVGVQLQNNVRVERKQVQGAADLVAQSARETWQMLEGTVQGLGGMLTNFEQAKKSVSGPVAVVAVGAEVARDSPQGLYSFAAIVNINLAVVNVLPLPALDGGYLVLLGIEAARGGKKLPKEVEGTFMFSGFVLLMGMGLFLIVKDTVNMLPK